LAGEISHASWTSKDSPKRVEYTSGPEGDGDPMEIDLTICKASEVVELVKGHERDHLPFAVVISIEHPCDESVSAQHGRAPRLAQEIGAHWADRQIILTCHDIEIAQPGIPAPSPDLVQMALDHFEKWRTNHDVMRVLLHCRSGKARSTALALILLRHHRGPESEGECLEEVLRIQPLAAPNLTIVQHGDAILGCGGALVRVVENDPAVTARRAEANFALLARAGQQAIERGALKDAELYLRESLAALATMPETSERIQREFSLLITLLTSVINTTGSGSQESMAVTERLHQLGEKSGNPDQLMLALIAAWQPLMARGEITASLRIADQMLEVVQRGSIEGNRIYAHLFQANSRMMLGDLRGAIEHSEAVTSSYKEADFVGAVVDPLPPALAAMARTLWHLGFTDQARAKVLESIEVAKRSAQASNLAQALANASGFYHELREPNNAEEVAGRLYKIASEKRLRPSLGVACVCRGWVMAERGRAAEGIALIREGIDHLAGRGNSIVPLIALSEAQARAGLLDDAIVTIELALSRVGEQRINLLRALWRRGELRILCGEATLAHSDFDEVIEIARRQGSKAYELRATISLARMLAKQSNIDAARSMLAEIYGCFTEGFDTADLKDAKALLVELGS
jgi:predicted protein tyrosine phosphatase